MNLDPTTLATGGVIALITGVWQVRALLAEQKVEVLSTENTRLLADLETAQSGLAKVKSVLFPEDYDV